MLGGKSITHKFEVKYQLKGLIYEQGYKSKANTHLNGLVESGSICPKIQG